MKNQRTLLLCYSALMCAMIVVSTLWLKFTLPGTEMLVTTQVFFILLCGQLLPARYCLYTVGAYLLIGLCGVPVFSATAGPAVLATPSFGYLLGFPFAAMVTSALRKKLGAKKGSGYIASLAGIGVIYVIALSYIAVLKGIILAAPVPFATLMTAYFLMFLPLDLVKGAFAAVLGARLRRILRLP